MSSKQSFIIATRASPLAMWQANFISQQLSSHYPQLEIHIRGIKTHADKLLDTPLNKLGGKGIFVKELEEALLNHEAHLAVHSLKDVPAFLPKGLVLGAICQREKPNDVWICPKGNHFDTIPPGSSVGTSSLRRLVQLKKMRSDLKYLPLRGNVGTRLRRCQSGEWDAIVLAQAGLIRLDLTHEITNIFAIEELLPAVGQGALGLECREDDDMTRQYIRSLDHAPTRFCIEAERAMNATLGGNCQVPVAGYACFENERIRLIGRVGDPETNILLETQKTGLPAQATEIGKSAANDLISQGANEIIEEIFKKGF